jgi:hypothetical protein
MLSKTIDLKINNLILIANHVGLTLKCALAVLTSILLVFLPSKSDRFISRI